MIGRVSSQLATVASTVCGNRGVRRRMGTAFADYGNAALELIVLAPILLGFLGLLIAAGRTSVAQGAVDAAARDAVRQASLATGPESALTAGRTSAFAALRQDGLDCSPTVRINTRQFSVAPGRPASVLATVSCSVPLSKLLLPGLPGSRQLTASFTSPLDIYRSR